MSKQKPAIDVTLYQQTSLVFSKNGKRGGQELLLAEIIGSLAGMKKVWLPFHCSGTLAYWLDMLNFDVITNPDFDDWSEKALRGQKPDAIYFGTPTIVENAKLFPESADGEWNVRKERKVVREIVALAEKLKVMRIISGLGSGDISLEERCEDMGRDTFLVCSKYFMEPPTDAAHTPQRFSDHVLVRNLY